METVFREGLTSVPTVLIVDGDGELVDRLRTAIKDAGYQPVCARDGREAMAAMTHRKPAVILIDDGLAETESSALMAKVGRSPALSRIPRVVLRAAEVAETDSSGSPTRFKRGGLDRILGMIRRLIGPASTSST
jgi:CheY-like chemotaxis protein